MKLYSVSTLANNTRLKYSVSNETNGVVNYETERSVSFYDLNRFATTTRSEFFPPGIVEGRAVFKNTWCDVKLYTTRERSIIITNEALLLGRSEQAKFYYAGTDSLTESRRLLKEKYNFAPGPTVRSNVETEEAIINEESVNEIGLNYEFIEELLRTEPVTPNTQEQQEAVPTVSISVSYISVKDFDVENDVIFSNVCSETDTQSRVEESVRRSNFEKREKLCFLTINGETNVWKKIEHSYGFRVAYIRKIENNTVSSLAFTTEPYYEYVYVPKTMSNKQYVKDYFRTIEKEINISYNTLTDINNIDGEFKYFKVNSSKKYFKTKESAACFYIVEHNTTHNGSIVLNKSEFTMDNLKEIFNFKQTEADVFKNETMFDNVFAHFKF